MSATSLPTSCGARDPRVEGSSDRFSWRHHPDTGRRVAATTSLTLQTDASTATGIAHPNVLVILTDDQPKGLMAAPPGRPITDCTARHALRLRTPNHRDGGSTSTSETWREGFGGTSSGGSGSALSDARQPGLRIAKLLV